MQLCTILVLMSLNVQSDGVPQHHSLHPVPHGGDQGPGLRLAQGHPLEPQLRTLHTVQDAAQVRVTNIIDNNITIITDLLYQMEDTLMNYSWKPVSSNVMLPSY